MNVKDHAAHSFVLMRRLNAVHCRRLLCGSAASKVHHSSFALAPYVDRPTGGFDRGSDFVLLTLQHDAFTNTDTMPIRGLYSSKAAAHSEEWTNKIFSTHSEAALDEEQLNALFSGIGLPPRNEQIKGMIAELAASGDAPYQRSEFAALMREAWDGAVFYDVRNDIDNVYPHLAPEQRRSLSWVGRVAPASFLLLTAQQVWPEHVERVTLMRNTCSNEKLNPALMQAVPEPFGDESGFSTAVELAAAAAVHAPTEEGGFVVQLDVVDEQRMTSETVLIPLFGLPENDEANAFTVEQPQQVRSNLLWQYGPPAVLLACCAALFAWLESVRKQKDEERSRERA